MSFAALGRKSVLQAVKEIFAGQPETPKPEPEPAPAAVPVRQAVPATPPVLAGGGLKPEGEVPPDAVAEGVRAAQPPADAAARPANLQDAAAGLIEAGVKFLESLAGAAAGGASGTAPGYPIQQVLAGLISRDPGTNRPVLSIPLPPAITEDRLAGAFAGLLNALGRRA